jgi:cytidylate kinase
VRVTRPFAIAIDGPAASGKSTTAKAVARALGARHVDSGALYRAATAARVRDGGPASSWQEHEVLAAARRVTLRPTAEGFVPCLDGEEAEAELRSEPVTAAVSRVAHFAGVREWVNAQVRTAAASFDVVVDGRDIGTVVLPAADLKVFLVADPDERARRRLAEQGPGRIDAAALGAERARLLSRDASDADNLLRAPDAVEIDTTALTIADQVDRIVTLARGLRGRESAGDC